MATAYTSNGTGGGNFSTAASWTAGSGYPSGAGDSFTVASGDTITVDVDNTAVELAASTVNGLLTFKTDATTGLAFGNVSLSIGATGEVRMGASGAVVGAAYTATLTFNPSSDNSKGIVMAAGAKFTAAGDPNKYGGAGYDVATLAADYTSGASFTITGDYSAKWASGQTVYIHKNALYSDINDLVLGTISGTPTYSAPNTTVTLSGTPSFPTGGYKSGGKVLNPSRNVIIAKASYTPTVSTSAVSNRPLWTDANTASGKVSIADADIRGFYNVLVATSTNNLGATLTRTVIRNCNRGIDAQRGLTFSGIVICCSGLGLSSIRDGSISGNILGCVNGVGSSWNTTISADVFCCTSNGIGTNGYGLTISGNVFSNSVGVSTICGNFSGSNYFNTTAFSLSSNTMLVTGYCFGNTTMLSRSSSFLFTGSIGYNSSGTAVANTTDFMFGPRDNSPATSNVICRGVKIQNPPTFSSRNGAGCGSQNYPQGVYFEDYCETSGTQTVGSHRAYLPTCDVIRNATTVRSSGATTSLECIPLSNCATDAPALVAEWTEVDVPASSQTRSVYCLGYGWSSWPTAAELYLEAEYYSDGSGVAKSTIASDEVLTDNTTWTALNVTFVPGQITPVRYKVWLKKYAASCKVFVDNMLVRT